MAMQVEVAYRDILKTVQVPAVCTALEAIKISKLLEEIQVKNLVIGIFSKKVPLDYKLKAGDRVEIYEPLRIKRKK